MPAAVRMRDDYSSAELRALAKSSKDAKQSRRLLSLGGGPGRDDRGEAAKIGGMDRQTLRDWVHRFNAEGPDGLKDNWTAGPTRGCRPGRRRNWRRSWRPGRTGQSTAWCAGGGSI